MRQNIELNKKEYILYKDKENLLREKRLIFFKHFCKEIKIDERNIIIDEEFKYITLRNEFFILQTSWDVDCTEEDIENGYDLFNLIWYEYNEYFNKKQDSYQIVMNKYEENSILEMCVLAYFLCEEVWENREKNI